MQDDLNPTVDWDVWSERMGLTLDGGIWHSGTPREVSYSVDGHSECFGVEEGSFWFKHRNECIGAVAQRFLTEPSSGLVEVGGGNGYVAQHLTQSGVPTLVVEPGAVGAMNAAGRGLTVIRGLLGDLPVPESSIPAWGLFDVLEHVEGELELLETMRRCSTDDAKLLITVPAFGWLWSDEDRDAGHYRRYSRTGLARVMKEAGWETTWSSYLFSWLPAVQLPLRVIPSRLGFYRGSSARAQQAQHSPGILAPLVAGSLSWESSLFRRGAKIPFGGSIIGVFTPR
ncbi:MAG: class I SAM-dependent methyltransferase [Planctomycetota bacterium]|nr:class I SAM-dependent methyltransferase [Planctomycetota bacterium]